MGIKMTQIIKNKNKNKNKKKKEQAPVPAPAFQHADLDDAEVNDDTHLLNIPITTFGDIYRDLLQRWLSFQQGS